MILGIDDLMILGGMIITLLTPVYSLSWKNFNNMNKFDMRLSKLEVSHEQHHGELYRVLKGDPTR